MAGRCLSLLRPFRMKKKKKKKKKEGPETSPAQQPEEMEQLYPLQEDSGRDQTQEQDRARGRFRRADQAFLKFMGIQRRKTRTSPTEVMAQPDTRLIKLTAKPYVGTAPTDRTMKSDPALNGHTRNSDTTLIDQRMKSDTSLTDDMTGAYSPSIDRMAISDIALTDDPTNSDTALPDLTAEADTATTEGITDTDPTPSDRVIDSPNWDFFEENGDSSSKQVPSRPDCGMAERSLSLCRLFRRKKEGPGVAPAQQPKEVEQSQPLQENPGRDRTEEQDPARGCWRFIGQMFRDFRGTAKADVSIKPKERTANTDTTPTQSLADAPGLDSSGERVVSAKVQAFMKNMHQRLTANMFPENRLFMDILRLTDTYPADVALTLLRCAPSCDRAAAIMWRTIALSETTVVRVLPTLLCVMEDWPQHSVSASDESNKDIFALAATRVVWEILQMIQCPEALMEYSPRLLVDLLFQVFISTEQMPEEVDTFWRRCWEGHRLARNPNRFAVLTMKTLLCRLQFENIVMAMERKRGWDTLLNSDTHHYAMGLLAREMRRASSPLCSPVALCLLGLLTREKPRWELPAMAFLVEVLVYLDVTDCGERILQLFSKHLRSECKERRRLALRGLVVLSKDPVMADGMQSLTQSLLDVLGDADGELVGMALSVFINEIQDRDIQISTPTALRLAEVLQPLFGNDKIHVQLLSIHLFRKVMELGVDEGKQPLKTHVIQSLLPLFFYWHDENQHVAEASWEVLIHALRFLKRRDLEQLVKKKQPWKFSECLLEKDRSRVANHLRQALPYLESPQEPLREAAIKFIGMAGRYLRGQKEELQLVMNALQRMTHDSAAVKSLAIKTLKMLRTAERPPSSLHSTSLKISSRMCGIERILCGAAARGQRRTDPGNPV
ncbi:maestro heat-like repeat-containing protein family member 6 [Pipra filicauda]|uniref:Maestro heat-like repeat-containing protein family member 6 n=1 Tax=Pipra filicauda TaxID=649802 RepID=A0A6J2J6X9_9PASS|nr:maestro heat-like repeat-containing protein family member 6 [Pipra filicauda]